MLVSITILLDSSVQACYVREVRDFDFKDLDQVFDYFELFFDIDGVKDKCGEIKYTPFGRWCIFHYDPDGVDQEVLITWENIEL